MKDYEYYGKPIESWQIPKRQPKLNAKRQSAWLRQEIKKNIKIKNQFAILFWRT